MKQVDFLATLVNQAVCPYDPSESIPLGDRSKWTEAVRIDGRWWIRVGELLHPATQIQRRMVAVEANDGVEILMLAGLDGPYCARADGKYCKNNNPVPPITRISDWAKLVDVN